MAYHMTHDFQSPHGRPHEHRLTEEQERDFQELLAEVREERKDRVPTEHELNELWGV